MKPLCIVAIISLACLAALAGCTYSPDRPVPPAVTETPTQAPTATAIELAPTPIASVTHTPAPTVTSTATPTLLPTPSDTPPATVTRTASGVRTVRVPILMYHYVSVPPADADKYRLDLSVTPEAFQAQMDYLVSAGYHTVRVADLTAMLLKGTPLPDKPIVLTFDDGYSDIFNNAYPILKAHGYTGTFFVIVDTLDENRWGYLNWAQVAEMAESGMEIGSHTMDHLDLSRMSRSRQTEEITASKDAIESHIGATVTSFSYPAGKYNAISLAVLESTGYTGAVTETQGALQSSSRVYELRRIRIRGSYTVADFAHWLKYYGESSH